MRAVVLLAALAASLTTLGLASDARAASCDQQVLRDWYADGQVDRMYELECYEVAVASLTPDLRDYTNAQQEIERALQSAARAGGAAESSARTPVASSSSSSLVAALAAVTAALAGGVWYARRKK